MAANVKKPAAAKARSARPAGKATQTRAGAGPAVAERSKDAKPAFGKAAPKKVELAARDDAQAARKPAAPKRAPAKAVARPPRVRKSDGAEAGADSVVAKVARAAKTTAAVAVGAVVATAKLAKPSRKKDDETAK